MKIGSIVESLPINKCVSSSIIIFLECFYCVVYVIFIYLLCVCIWFINMLTYEYPWKVYFCSFIFCFVADLPYYTHFLFLFIFCFCFCHLILKGFVLFFNHLLLTSWTSPMKTRLLKTFIMVFFFPLRWFLLSFTEVVINLFSFCWDLSLMFILFCLFIHKQKRSTQIH